MSLGSVLTKCSPWASPPQLRPWARTSKEPSSARERPPPRGLFLLPTAASARLLLAVGFDPPPPPNISRHVLVEFATDPPQPASLNLAAISRRQAVVGSRLDLRDQARRLSADGPARSGEVRLLETLGGQRWRTDPACLIDGEVVCCDDRGSPSSRRCARRNEADAFLYAFDCSNSAPEPIEVPATLVSILRKARHGVRRTSTRASGWRLCSSTPAGWGSRGSCRSGWDRVTDRADHLTSSANGPACWATPR